MILGQDQAMLFPTMDLYDSGMMQMYANAVQREYERGLNDQKEFIAKYGDFISPIASDVEYWNANTMDPLADTIDKMRAAGIDPTRSPEARAILSRQMMNLPYAKLAEMKQSAKAAEQYMKMRAEMQAKGLWNPDYERFILGGRTLENWDTARDGMWTRTSPEEYQDLNAKTKHWYDQMEKGYIYTDRDGYEWWGNTEDDIRKVAKEHLPDLTSNYWMYQKDLARRQSGSSTFDENAQKQFEDNLAAAASEKYTRMERREGSDRKRKEDYRYSNMLDAAKTRRDETSYLIKSGADTNGDGALSQKERADWAAAINVDASGSSSSGSRSGSNSGGTNTQMPLGPADQLIGQQDLNILNNKIEFINNYNRQKDNAFKIQKQIYNGLNDVEKKNARIYGQSYRTRLKYSNKKNLTDEEQLKLDKAIQNINNLDNKKDSSFVKWRNQFNKRMESYDKTPDQAWTDFSTTEGLVNRQPSTENKLLENSRKIWERNNEVTGLTEVQKKYLDTQLGVDGGKKGVMTPNKTVMQNTQVEMTGNRRFTHNSTVNKVERIIKGKPYNVVDRDLQQRRYGSGVIKGKHHNVITDVATFTDPSVINELDKLNYNELNKLGIVKSTVIDSATKKEKDCYKVPIASRFQHGQGNADVNSQYDKQYSGVSTAEKFRPTRQAREITMNLDNK